MLQFTITDSKLLTIEQQTEMAIKAGCQWIELDPKEIDGANVEEVIARVIKSCQEAGIILIFKHDDILVDKLRVHGIKLSNTDASPLELRQRYGGHAIIGVEITPESDFAMLKRADVDYVVARSVDPKYITDIKVKMTETNVNIPIVAEGKMTLNNFMPLLSAGASGFNIDITSLKGPEYSVSLREMISSIPF